MGLGKRLKRWLPSLQMSLGGAFVSIVLLTSLLLGATLYVSLRRFILNDLRARLREAAGVAALQLDPAEQGRIRSRADESSAAYAHVRRQLEAIRARARDVRFAYTLRKDPAGRIVFVVDAEDDPKKLAHVGEPYPAPTPAMRAVFEKPYAPHVEKSFVEDKWGKFISGYAPLLGPDGEAVGALGLDLSAADAAAFENKFLLEGLLVLVVISSLVAGLSLALTGKISRPLTELARDMGRIQSFDLDSPIDTSSNIREIAEMQDALQGMKMGLRSFKRYVPSDLVSDLIELGREATLGAEYRPLTVLFSDIENFTAMSETLPPERLAESLGVYLEGMTRAILDEGGTVDKYIGDAVMAFWNAPHPAEDHAARACRAALRCQRFVAERFGSGRREGEPAFRTRIGVHTGKAYVGNFGFRDRLSYTAIGDTVNLASRLEGLNKHYGTLLMVSEATLAEAGGAFAARALDRVAVKGRRAGVLIHELLGEAASLGAGERDYARRFNEAVASYEKRDWAGACARFAALLEERPDDRPARALLERCREFAVRPPAAEWDGVFVMRSK